MLPYVDINSNNLAEKVATSFSSGGTVIGERVLSVSPCVEFWFRWRFIIRCRMDQRYLCFHFSNADSGGRSWCVCYILPSYSIYLVNAIIPISDAKISTTAEQLFQGWNFLKRKGHFQLIEYLKLKLPVRWQSSPVGVLKSLTLSYHGN